MNMKRYTQYMYSYPHKTAYGPLEGVTLNQYLPDLAGPGHGLYPVSYTHLTLPTIA